MSVVYDANSSSFRGDKRRYVSNAEVLRLVDAEVARQETRLKGHARLLVNGKVDTAEFQKRMANDLKLSAIRMAALGAGGVEGLGSRHYGKIGSELKKQYKFLAGFGDALVKGLTEKQILQRAGQYSRQSAIAFHSSQQITKEQDGFTTGRRDLDGQAKHCKQCIEYSTNGAWVPVSELIPVGSSCDCGGRCRCRITFRKDGKVGANKLVIAQPQTATPEIAKSTATALAKTTPTKEVKAQQEIKSTAADVPDKIPPKTAALIIKNGDDHSVEKIERMVKAGMKRHEAVAFSGYLGADYEEINRTIWDKDAKSFLGSDYAINKARATAATQGIERLQPATVEQINAIVSEKGNNKDIKPYEEGEPLTHGMRVPEYLLQEMLEKHKVAAEKGEFVTAGKFMSTSWAKGGEAQFVEPANVIIKVQAKLDGTGQGKLVDKFKENIHENEILFAPTASFRVARVEEVPEIPAKKGTIQTEQTTDQYKHLSALKGLPPDKDIAKKIMAISGIKYSQLAKTYNLPPQSQIGTDGFKEAVAEALKQESKKTKIIKKQGIIQEAIPTKYVFYYEEVD